MGKPVRYDSVWSASVNGKGNARPKLTGGRNIPVLIIGAGMAGMLTAWRLKEAGVSCIVVDAKTVGSGVTKNTTAKITAQHGLIYSDLIQRFGIDTARLYSNANIRAITAFLQLAADYPCDVEEKRAYVYTMNNRNKLEKEAIAYLKIGLNPQIEDAPLLPFHTAGALRMDGQAQFNPMKLLSALSDELEIYENTFVQKIDGNVAVTSSGNIHAEHIVIATHFPLINIPGLYFIKLYQHRSYVIALEGAQLPDGMYIDESESGYSFRTYGDLLLVGGGGHKTGKQGGGFCELENLAKRIYPNAKIRYRWATQDCMTLDNVPYIGRHQAASNNLYVATGFNKWGMTGSMVAAELISDLIVKGKSELEALYFPQRSMWTKQLATNIGSAAVGLLSVGRPRCSHMGCKLHKNHVEGTWDCPCHGSRYDQSGNIINNPAKKRI